MIVLILGYALPGIPPGIPPVDSVYYIALCNKSTFEKTALPNMMFAIKKGTDGLHLTRILGLEKTALRKICISETVGGPLLTQKSLTCPCISQKSR